jgi:hypothetical protein
MDKNSGFIEKNEIENLRKKLTRLFNTTMTMARCSFFVPITSLFLVTAAFTCVMPISTLLARFSISSLRSFHTIMTSAAVLNTRNATNTRIPIKTDC